MLLNKLYVVIIQCLSKCLQPESRQVFYRNLRIFYVSLIHKNIHEIMDLGIKEILINHNGISRIFSSKSLKF